jgi:hypothetical protein
LPRHVFAEARVGPVTDKNAISGEVRDFAVSGLCYELAPLGVEAEDVRGTLDFYSQTFSPFSQSTDEIVARRGIEAISIPTPVRVNCHMTLGVPKLTGVDFDCEVVGGRSDPLQQLHRMVNEGKVETWIFGSARR